MDNQNGVLKLKDLLRSARYAVFFGGAGVSTASGIPDFRGSGGLYRADDGAEGFPPEYMLSRDCLVRRPKLFFDYYRTHMLYPDARPNAAHLALAQMEREGLIKAVITQNIDGLHRAAGSRAVYELHGTTARAYCEDCGRAYGGDYIAAADGVPRCETCGGVVRPDVVLYGEGLDETVFSAAAERLDRADLLVVGGTSLTVNPAAALAAACRARMAIVNLSPTPYDGLAEILIRDRVDTVLPALLVP